MSWTDSHPIEPVLYRWRVVGAFVAALALVFSVAAPAALPGIVGAVAEAQTTALRAELDSADQLSIPAGDTATFEGHFVDGGTVEELEFSATVPQLEFEGAAYTLTIDGEEIPVREGDNLVVDTTSNAATFRVTGLNADVPAGAAFSLETPAVAEESELSGVSVDVRGVAEENASASADEDSEVSEAPTDDGEPLEVSDVDAAPARLMTAPSITTFAAGTRTITMQNDGYVLKGTRYIPNFKIPSAELPTGRMTIPNGTVVTLKSNVNSYLSTSPDDLTVYYTGANGGWYEAKATYKKISAKEYQVTLPQITIGGNAQIQFKGVHRGPDTTVFTASFTVPEPEQCKEDTKKVARQPRRDLTDEEYTDGSPVYVVTSEPKDLRRDTSVLSRQVNHGRDFRPVGEKSPWVYNALAFNSNDNWLYAVSQKRGLNGDPCYPAGNLLQINPATGEVHNLGPILAPGSSGTPFESEGDRDFLNAGVYTSEGFFVGNASTSGTRHLYKIDPDKLTADRTLRSAESFAEDWAVLPQAQKYMWGFQSKAKADNSLILERIDTQTGAIQTWDLTKKLKTLDGRTISNPSASWGKAWTYSNGNLGFGSGSKDANQLGFELKITNPDSGSPKFELVNIMDNLPASFNTDAASDLLPPPSRLRSNIAVKKQRSETKVVNGEVRTFWTISVENTTDNTSSGGTFWEYLPTDTHYGVNATGPTAKFEGFGEGSTEVNGHKPGPDQIAPGTGIYAGMTVPSGADGESRYMKGYVGTLPGHAKVEYVVSAPVRTDKYGNLKTVCSPNKVAFQATDGEAGSDNVATEACFSKVAVDSAPQPVPGAANEYTAKYNVVVAAPDAPGFDTNEVIYGKLTDTPKFVGAATVTGATVVFKDEFNKTSQPQSYQGAGPYELNKNDTPKIIKPKGVNGSSGQHVYEVTVRFKLDRTKLNSTSVPAGYPSQPAGNSRCYTKDGLHEPNFGLMNEAEMGGWKDTSCIPLETKQMDVLLEKVSYDPAAPDKIQTDELLDGAQFTVHRGDADGNLKLNADGTVNTDANPVVKQSTTTTTGRVKLEGLDAPGVYYLIETKAPDGYNLLPAPIKFSTEWDQNGNAVIKVLSGGTAITSNRCAESDTAANCVKKVGILQVADITKGALPKTGGEGVGLWALAGAAIVAAGCLALRRRWV
ncbi:prealbumin-like fold domain-containing protein [Corynebacterium sp. HMSC072A04]|uniref:prealbumin-like fold domain-containing protein n=1 Tax=Corynebacterium sp. HMSC072A04 TaxID=1715045 RepID=UPI0008B5EE1E|nr:prealbumin-like fold domain-containing protein [Corynebacterium sp. HMSC072A04]OFN34886.1 cell surface protein [Corynebacterium sp. HMSC072A04]